MVIVDNHKNLSYSKGLRSIQSNPVNPSQNIVSSNVESSSSKVIDILLKNGKNVSKKMLDELEKQIPKKRDVVVAKSIPFSCSCSQNNLKSKFDEMRKSRIGKTVKSTDQFFYYNPAEIAKLNPYLRSIVGTTYLNLAYFKNKFNVFFATQNTPKIDISLNFQYQQIPTVIPFTDSKIISITKAITCMGDLIEFTINVVPTYEEADYVICNCIFNPPLQSYAAASPPAALGFPETDNKIWITYNAERTSSVNTEIGSTYFYSSLHELCHSLGLGHPFDKAQSLYYMPGVNGDPALFFENQGLFNMNNILTTLLSYVQLQSTDVVDTATTFPRNFGPLDLQALRLFYGIEITDKYVKNWVDSTLSNGVSQTLASTPAGLSLAIAPSLAPSPPNTLFNLNLQPFIVNPMCDGINSIGIGSRSAIGDSPIGALADFFASHILDKESTISKVLIGYPEFNVYTGTILYNTVLEVNSPDVKEVNIYIKCKSSNYNILRTLDNLVVKNKKTGKYISLTKLTPTVTATVTFSVNS